MRLGLGIAVVLFVASAGPAAGDEIRQWRDAEGRLHFSIRGAAGAGATASDEAPIPILGVREVDPAERLSVRASMRRRALEKALRENAGRLAAARAALAEAEARMLVISTSRLPDRIGGLGAALDAQRNALLQAQMFEGERRRDVRGLLREMIGHYEQTEELRTELAKVEQEVVESFGERPAWWRELDCDACPSVEEAAGERERLTRRLLEDD